VLNGTTIIVDRNDGDGPEVLSCTIGPSSPSTSGFAVGSSVRMYCSSGALYQLRSNTPPPATTTTTTTTTTSTPPTDVSTADGALSALSATSITVGGLTCAINGSSASTSGFAVGSSARMYCKAGALYALLHL
jgi:hypothetical protein